jgi:hypothetical protein
MQGIRTGVLGFALSSFIANAWADELCARASDLIPLQVAAVQQQLMLAALACHDTDLYNTFVVAYRQDLLASDAALQAFFMRLNKVTGGADYHTYKTKLANAYSLRTVVNTEAYCGLARVAFQAALRDGKKTLTEFAMSQPVSFATSYESCGERVTGGAMVAQIPVPQAATVVAPAISAPPPILSAKPEAGSSNSVTAASVGRNNNTAPARGDNRNSPAQPGARRYDGRDPYARDPYARDPYARGYSDPGYNNRYGGRDAYYRYLYDRYWYGSTRQ